MNILNESINDYDIFSALLLISLATINVYYNISINEIYQGFLWIVIALAETKVLHSFLEDYLSEQEY